MFVGSNVTGKVACQVLKCQKKKPSVHHDKTIVRIFIVNVNVVVKPREEIQVHVLVLSSKQIPHEQIRLLSITTSIHVWVVIGTDVWYLVDRPIKVPTVPSTNSRRDCANLLIV